MTREYEMWWRDVGQFLQPCDRLEGEALEPFKRWGWEAWAMMQGELMTAKSEAEEAESDKEEAQEGLRTLRDEISDALKESGADILQLTTRLREAVKCEAP